MYFLTLASICEIVCRVVQTNVANNNNSQSTYFQICFCNVETRKKVNLNSKTDNVFDITGCYPVSQDDDSVLLAEIDEQLKLPECSKVEVSKKFNDSIFLYLYTAKNSTPYIIVPNNISLLPKNNLESLKNKRLKIVIHGLMSSYNSTLSQDLKNGD